jgi:hypothetical protein
MRPLLAFSALIILAAPAAAQVTETPVPFDTAGRIVSVNSTLAARLGLTQPAWPVTGAFVEARLYQISSGGYSLVVSRAGGALERFALDDAKAAALRTAFAEGIAREGRVVAEDAASIISEPARGPFVRDQMIIAAAIYGPSVSYLSHDEAIGTGLYMMTVGGTFFALNEFSRKRTITKSQNSLTTDGAFRGWAATALGINMLGADPSGDAVAILALSGGIGGSLLGFNRGRTLTNSEAAATMTMSTLAAGAALGTAATVGLIDDGNDNAENVASGAILAGGIAGYALGARYPRKASYTVTAGDVSIVRLGAILGAMAAVTPFTDLDRPDEKLIAGVLTTGWVGGAFIADRIGAKRFNYSLGDSRMVALGALGGGFIGAALPIMAESESGVFTLGAITGGAILGAFATHGMTEPARQGSLIRNQGANGNSAKVQFQPEGLLLAAAKQRGNHTLLSIRF